MSTTVTSRPHRRQPLRRRLLPLAVAAALGGLAALPAYSQSTTPTAVQQFSLPAQPLGQALNALARQSGVAISVDAALVAGKSAPAVQGAMTLREALQRLLAGSGLVAAPTGSAITIRAAGASDAGATLAPVTVTAQADRATTENTGAYTTGSMSTATKLSLSIRETPQSVTVMTRQRMDDEGMVTLSDAIRATPGLVVSKGGPERDGYYSRGFWVGNVTYDGLPTSMDTSWYGSDVLLSDLAVYDRVEIVRGATGLASGSGDPSAAINLVRKRPTKETQISLSGNAGSWNRYGLQADVSGSLNESRTLRARAVASTQDNESFQDVVSSRRNILYLTGEADLGTRTLLTVGASRQ